MPQHERTSEERIHQTSACQADFIFYAQPRTTNSRPVKVLDEYACDYRRPDWEHRWAEWNTHQNPYLNLFLCREHARQLGLME